jgi:tRNA A-37 threonylcarbamoyl transferase component Bud32
MTILDINPAYEGLLRRHGLASAEDLLALPGLIVSGHPDRHVARVTLGGLSGYLKREHLVRRRDRLGSAWAGFGPVSRSVREARTLAALRGAGVACPDWVAAGEDDRGRAFLLVADVPGGVDLRQFLRERRGTSRHEFAAALGREVARVHEAGFDHPDLYAKHVLVDPRTEAICFLDWQRSRPWRRVAWPRRVRDLAALDATLADDLADAAERLACLRAYVRGCGLAPLDARPLADEVRRQAERLLRRRHVRKERESPPPVAAEGVYWLDGEALCVTQGFWSELGGAVPEWLPLPAAPEPRKTEAVVRLPGGGRGTLVRRCDVRPLSWLWSALRGRPLLSPELREAGACFRRAKHGQEGPRVLAFGQRRPRPWRTESFLLTEAV